MRVRPLLLLFLLIGSLFTVKASSHINTNYNENDVLHGDGKMNNGNARYQELYEEHRSLRTREIQRRLTRNHGYTSTEISSMIHKSELVHVLTSEVLEDERKKRNDLYRKQGWHMFFTFVIAAVIYVTAPVWIQAYDIISVNIVVFTDRKRHEASRVYEIGSFWGYVGFLILAVLEGLSFWLSITVMLSWVMRPKPWFFPTPSIPIRPGALLNSATGGNPANRTGLAGYAMNCGPMAVSWGLRYLNGVVQGFMGRALSSAQKAKKKAQKEAKRRKRTPEEREARRAEKMKRNAKRNAQDEAAINDASKATPSTNEEKCKDCTPSPVVENIHEYVFDDLD